MKSRLLLATLLATAFAAQPGIAASSKTPAKNAASTQTDPATQPSPPNVDEFDKQYALMQERMTQMHAQMAQIQQTSDPQERQKLLQQHWATMQESFGLMNGMWQRGGMGPGMMGGGMGMGRGMMMGGGPGNGPGMMGGAGPGTGPGAGPGYGGGRMMNWQGMHGYYNKLTPQQQRQRQYMRDQYMGMQQQMMNQMMQRQYWMNPPAAGK